MSESLSGQVVRVTFENEETSFRVLRVEVPGRGILVAVGNTQFVAPGTHVRLTGEFTRDPRHGEQFRIEALVSVEPTTLDGIEKYLGSGLIPGIGPGFAKRIVAAFGLETLQVLDQTPERLREVSGLGEQRKKELLSAWKEQRGLGQLTLMLHTHGVPGYLARRILERYGEDSARIVQTSPYRLSMDVQGIGFKTADRLAASLGISKDHPERALAGVLHQLHAARDQGHVFVPREGLARVSAEMLEIDSSFTEAAIDSLWASERVVVEDGAVALSFLQRAEVSLCADLGRLSNFGAPGLARAEAVVEAFEARQKLTLASEQKRAIRAVAEHKVVVITGGPGVGKTTIVRAVIEVFDAARLTTKLAAPTGRAAKRMAEATGRPALTLHRLLEFDPKLRRFARNTDNPLEAQALIIDEASMIDLPLAASLFAAVPDPARVVIVGDVDQLPSVGPGAILRDLIDSGRIAVVRLTEIFRQAQDSGIVQSAHAILKGSMPEALVKSDKPPDFFIIERKDAEQALRTIEEVVARRIPQRFGFDTRTEIQVLCPMHKGACGTLAVNELLQRLANGEGEGVRQGEQTFRVRDRVMQLRNDYDREVFNGDVGFVSAVDSEARKLTVDFEGKSVEYESSELEQLSLAYATSIHKSQGSEYPVVVIPFLMAHFPMLSRNLLYTAVTRARKLCVLVADPRAIRTALSEVRKEARSTHLIARLGKTLG
ncbi:MAG TPA: ATP-dependent RecD-like DNA helicase [Polyangiaceae bacterium]|nr:ATP-dependent RecD-like DNA helicase [Polyangiaceae bacterium]